jgi:hypothetical protein
MAKKNIVKLDISPLAGNSIQECRLACDCLIFVAKGFKARKWKLADQAEAAILADRKLGAIDPETIALIMQMIMEIMEQKE